MSLVELAHEVLNLHYENLHLKKEIARLRKIEDDYNTLLNNSLNHSNVMMNHLVSACIGLGEEGVKKTFGSGGGCEDH